MSGTITPIKSKIEIIREIKPFGIENVVEEKDVIDAKLHIAEHSKLWLEHTQKHPGAKLQLIGATQQGLSEKKEYVLKDMMSDQKLHNVAQKAVSEEPLQVRKPVILAGCNCGMVVEIGSDKKGQGYVKSYEASGMHASANEYGVVSTGQSSGNMYGKDSSGQDYGNSQKGVYK